MWDEMALSSYVDYDAENDYIIGFEDWGTVSIRTYKFADHALVFMIKRLFGNWKLPLSYHFCASQTKHPRLTSCIKEVLQALILCGLIVDVTVCDQGSSNLLAVKTLKQLTRKDMIRSNRKYDENIIEIGGQRFVHIYDPSHLCKGFRNNLLTKDLVTTDASGQEIQRAQCVNGPAGSISIPRLEGNSTADALEFMNDLFDSVNGQNLGRGTDDPPLRRLITDISSHHAFWDETLQKL
ncbi:uncharacterized protein LOC114254765 [Monomorium pharaonis]|uniref:uncharacterized protein LOC114254765 n=1 Tax=Monomorium pharaonis TaxID=307658 RepID=UPI001745DA1A|nr:uncharacterized protein LOC114254765 [Monomorium pharaonis]